MASTKSGRGRYNGNNINLPRKSSPEGMKRRLAARQEAWQDDGGASQKPGSMNRRKH